MKKENERGYRRKVTPVICCDLAYFEINNVFEKLNEERL